MNWPTVAKMLCSAALVAGLAGCVVPQPRGHGQLQRIVEPTTRRGYWLYLPESYLENQGRRSDGRRWPLVMSFHGMKPFDDAHGQAREFEQEADNYGFVICAPELRSSDLLGQFPVKRVDRTWQQDEEAILKIMDHVFATTSADPQCVLATSWSYGGYVAHYMINRHPHRFSCLAVRQSNFAPEILDLRQIPYYRQMPVAIFFGQNDFARTRLESQIAVDWYTQRGFPNLVSAKVVGRGHERIPQTAAAFFAQNIDVQPIKPWSAGSSLAAVTLQREGSVPPARPPAAEPPRPKTVAASPYEPRPQPTPSSPPRQTVHSPPPSGRSDQASRTPAPRHTPRYVVRPASPEVTRKAGQTAAANPTRRDAPRPPSPQVTSEAKRVTTPRPTPGNALKPASPAAAAGEPKRTATPSPSPRTLVSPTGSDASSGASRKAAASPVPANALKPPSPDAATSGASRKTPASPTPRTPLIPPASGTTSEASRRAMASHTQKEVRVPARPDPATSAAKREATARPVRSKERNPGSPVARYDLSRPLPEPRTAAQPTAEQPVRIKCSHIADVAPLMIAFQADLSGLPAAARQGAEAVWSLNHIPFSYEIRGYKLLREPGPYELFLIVTLRDGRTYHDTWCINVREDLDKKKRKGSRR